MINRFNRDNAHLKAPNMKYNHKYVEGGRSKHGYFWSKCECGMIVLGKDYASSKTKILHHINWARELSKEVK